MCSRHKGRCRIPTQYSHVEMRGDVHPDRQEGARAHRAGEDQFVTAGWHHGWVLSFARSSVGSYSKVAS